MTLRNFLLASLLVAAVLMTPAMAGEKYLFGSPDIEVAIAGTNEFAPGDEVPLTVVVENRGLVPIKIVGSDIITRDDLPNTAKLAVVELGAGDAPLTIQSDRQMVGDIKGGASIPVTFQVKFAEDAAPGSYRLPVIIFYTYLGTVEQYGSDTVRYFFDDAREVRYVTVNVKSEASLEVVEVSTDSMNIGTEGYLTLTLRNAGHTDAKDAILRLSRNAASPLVPTTSSVFIGSFPQDSTITARFKVAVSSDAEEQEYPIDVYMEYRDSAGESATTDHISLGVPVGGKIDFAVDSGAPEVRPGEKAVIEVTYRNTGAAPVYNAQARISAVDPFSSNDDTAFLGDLAPGTTAKAIFEVTVAEGATVKVYGLDSEIRYRDALDNSQISDTVKVEVSVVPASGIMTVLSNPVVIAAILFLVIGIGYYVRRALKNRA
ncbi:MAG: S-layer protein [Methanomicrobiaceae archaeon]|nr:S-layer protein [Methanomicrobiaceae archaeon]